MKQHLVPYSRVDVTAVEWKATATLALVVDHFLLLPIGVLIALVWANAAGESYFRFAHALRFLVNDVGMALFIGLIFPRHEGPIAFLLLIAVVSDALGVVSIAIWFPPRRVSSRPWADGRGGLSRGMAALRSNRSDLAVRDNQWRPVMARMLLERIVSGARVGADRAIPTASAARILFVEAPPPTAPRRLCSDILCRSYTQLCAGVSGQQRR